MNTHARSVPPMAQAVDFALRERRDRATARGRPAALPRNMKMLIAAVLIAFGVLHVIGGAMFHTRSSAASAQATPHMLAAD